MCVSLNKEEQQQQKSKKKWKRKQIEMTRKEEEKNESVLSGKIDFYFCSLSLSLDYSHRRYITH